MKEANLPSNNLFLGDDGLYNCVEALSMILNTFNIDKISDFLNNFPDIMMTIMDIATIPGTSIDENL